VWTRCEKRFTAVPTSPQGRGILFDGPDSSYSTLKRVPPAAIHQSAPFNPSPHTSAVPTTCFRPSSSRSNPPLSGPVARPPPAVTVSTSDVAADDGEGAGGGGPGGGGIFLQLKLTLEDAAGARWPVYLGVAPARKPRLRLRPSPLSSVSSHAASHCQRFLKNAIFYTSAIRNPKFRKSLHRRHNVLISDTHPNPKASKKVQLTLSIV